MGINKDQVEGRVKEAAGKVQESAGKAVAAAPSRPREWPRKSAVQRKRRTAT